MQARALLSVCLCKIKLMLQGKVKCCKSKNAKVEFLLKAVTFCILILYLHLHGWI